MRCFMRGGRIAGVTFLKTGSDEELIAQAHSALAQHVGQGFDGFEVWDGTRFVHRSNVTTTPSGSDEANG